MTDDLTFGANIARQNSACRCVSVYLSEQDLQDFLFRTWFEFVRKFHQKIYLTLTITSLSLFYNENVDFYVWLYNLHYSLGVYLKEKYKIIQNTFYDSKKIFFCYFFQILDFCVKTFFVVNCNYLS